MNIKLVVSFVMGIMVAMFAFQNCASPFTDNLSGTVYESDSEQESANTEEFLSVSAPDPLTFVNGLSDVNAKTGDDVELKVKVDGDVVSYVWEHKKSVIPNETTRKLKLDNLVPMDSGSYSVKAYAANGSSITSKMSLKVSAPTVKTCSWSFGLVVGPCARAPSDPRGQCKCGSPAVQSANACIGMIYCE